MAQYRVLIPYEFGSFNVGGFPYTIFYEEGSNLLIAFDFLDGITSVDWYIDDELIGSGALLSLETPPRDITIRGEISGGAYVPVDDYGPLYYADYKDAQGADLRLEILKNGYSGATEEVYIGDVFQNFGEGSENAETIIKTLVRGSLDFELIGIADKYLQFLDFGIREFRVIFKKNSSIKFQGYLSVDFITYPNLDGNVVHAFTAVDGLQQMESFRPNLKILPEGSFQTENLAYRDIIGILNQSFTSRRNVNIGCNLYEDRMNSSLNLFTQFYTPYAAVLTDGQLPKYENGEIIYNEVLQSNEALENLLRPFMCRVFMWENEFWIVRIPDMNNPTYAFTKFDGEAVFIEDSSVTNNLELDCDFDYPTLPTGRAYTEFTVKLNTGVLTLQAEGAIFEYKFDVKDFYKTGNGDPYPGRWRLNDWQYVNSRPTNDPSSVPTGDLALVQYVSDNNGEMMRIWTTTTTAGLSDPNLSYQRLKTFGNGQNYLIADEVANTMSIEFEFLLYSVSRSQEPNTYMNHSVAFMVKIGDYYLYEVSANVFGFDTTPNIVTVECPNSGAWNDIKISKVTVPTTDFVEVRLYQAVLDSGERHKYSMNFRNFKLSIEENEAILLSELGVKAKTSNQFSSVFPDYDIRIGDTETSMSSSAIKLITPNFYEVSESWTSQDTISEPLFGVVVQDLANLFGRTYRFLRGTLQHQEVRPYQSIVYEGKYWMITYLRWNVRLNNYTFVAFEFPEIETT